MSAVTHDVTPGLTTRDATRGLLFALLSAVSFGLSGPLARGLTDAGWSPGAAVGARILLGALVLVVPAGLQLRGRWQVLRRNLPMIVAYGVIAVVVTQLCFFYAIQYMQVGPALLVEYTAPVLVVGWMWLRHGQRPSALTIAGAVVCAAGLVLVLDLVSGVQVSVPGILWALGAAVGVATYFVLSAHEAQGLPPLALAAGGLVVGGLLLAGLGLVGVLPMTWSTAPVEYAVGSTPWWLPVLALGVVTAGLAYASGIEGIRRLGSRLASFVSLTEVLAAVLGAWLLLAELPGGVQVVGGVLILAGVVLVRLGEPRRVSERPAA